MSSQKSFQQLTMEKEQALADLNSVERSLSDLFRRYENLKGVLEGFKKVPVLCLLSPQWHVFLLMGRQTHVPKVWVAQKRNQGLWAACLNPSSSQSGQQALDMTRVWHRV